MSKEDNLSSASVDCLDDADGSLHPLNEMPCSHKLKAVVSESNLPYLKKAIESYRIAEDYIKRAELATTTLDIPSINELRYFGFHLSKALACDESQESQQQEELRRAEKHCKRAGYDAVELGIISCSELIVQFDRDHREAPVVISDVISNYATKRARFGAIKDELSRQQKSDRDQYLESCFGFLDELKDISREFESARDDLRRKILLYTNVDARAQAAEDRAQGAEERAERAEKKADKISAISLLVAIVSCAALATNTWINSKQPQVQATTQSQSPAQASPPKPPTSP